MAAFHHVTFKAYRINQSWRFPTVESSDVSIQYGRIYFKSFHVVRYLFLETLTQNVLPPQQKLQVSSGQLKPVGLFYRVRNCAGFRV